MHGGLGELEGGWERGKEDAGCLTFKNKKKCSIFTRWGTKDESLSGQIHSFWEIYFHSKQWQ